MSGTEAGVINVRILRTLDVSASPGEGSVPYLSAASGLARIGRHLYVIADDEHCLGVFDLTDGGPGRLFRLFEGELPSRDKDRKGGKPDLEAMTELPAFESPPFGALLAVGSGSKANRQRAVLMRLDDHGAIDGSAGHLDLGPLYEPLRNRFPDLNIEGLFVAGGDLCLLQRGNRASRVNVDLACKAEGIAVVADGKRLELLLVTDADDRRAPAQLLSLTLPRA